MKKVIVKNPINYIEQTNSITDVVVFIVSLFSNSLGEQAKIPSIMLSSLLDGKFLTLRVFLRLSRSVLLPSLIKYSKYDKKSTCSSFGIAFAPSHKYELYSITAIHHLLHKIILLFGKHQVRFIIIISRYLMSK